MACGKCVSSFPGANRSRITRIPAIGTVLQPRMALPARKSRVGFTVYLDFDDPTGYPLYIACVEDWGDMKEARTDDVTAAPAIYTARLDANARFFTDDEHSIGWKGPVYFTWGAGVATANFAFFHDFWRESE